MMYLLTYLVGFLTALPFVLHFRKCWIKETEESSQCKKETSDLLFLLNSHIQNE